MYHTLWSRLYEHGVFTPLCPPTPPHDVENVSHGIFMCLPWDNTCLLQKVQGWFTSLMLGSSNMLVIPGLGRQSKPGTCWLPCLAAWVRQRPVRDPISKRKRKAQKEQHPRLKCTCPCTPQGDGVTELGCCNNMPSLCSVTGGYVTHRGSLCVLVGTLVASSEAMHTYCAPKSMEKLCLMCYKIIK